MLDQRFRRLHDGELLILPNAWDAGSARLIESRGAKAIATTSAGLAWSRGYPDGDALPIEELLSAVRAIARVIGVPLTIDVEGGYSNDPAAVARLVAGILEAGPSASTSRTGPARLSCYAPRSRRQGRAPGAPASSCSSMPAPMSISAAWRG